MNLLSVEKNLKKIAFICNVDEELVADFKDKNSQFFKNGKLDLEKFNDKMNLWENELKFEIVQRTSDSYPAIDFNYKIFDINKEELEESFKENLYNITQNNDIRKEIVENLIRDPHSLQDISEISGIDKSYVNLMIDERYYNRYLEKYYEKYANEELIDYKV